MMLLCALASGCFGGHWAPSPDASPPTDAVIRVTYTNAGPCPGRAARLPRDRPVDDLCAAIDARPRSFTSAYVTPGCFGGMPATMMHVTGVIAGRQVHLRQSGMCGPRGVHTWYDALYAQGLLQSPY